MATKIKHQNELLRIEPVDWDWVTERAHEIYDPIKRLVIGGSFMKSIIIT
jgi:hypothetical protein